MNIKIDDYLKELKQAIEKYIRKNDPSELFRRICKLLCNSDENGLVLHDAIKNEHIKLVLPLIEQIINMCSRKDLLEKVNKDGKTPLLMAVKFKQWILIESIIKKSN
ncbi:unnamed protein product [Rotaria sp. Silwood2]|nr:unnamed protein product [Rotaria sp. Silwood2]